MKNLTKIIIIGGGGHARVVRDALDACGGFDVLGYTDRQACSQMDIPYLGTDDDLNEFSPQEISLANGIGSVRLPELRQNIFEGFKRQGYCFVVLVHPKAHVSSRARLHEGAQIFAGAIINTGADIGANVLVNTAASVDHDCRIGAHTHIAPGVTLSGGVIVGESSHVGTGAKIIQGIHIGSHVLVGAGAVVRQNIPEGQTYL